jgi:hypothetical protein
MPTGKNFAKPAVPAAGFKPPTRILRTPTGALAPTTAPVQMAAALPPSIVPVPAFNPLIAHTIQKPGVGAVLAAAVNNAAAANAPSAVPVMPFLTGGMLPAASGGGGSGGAAPSASPDDGSTDDGSGGSVDPGIAQPTTTDDENTDDGQSTDATQTPDDGTGVTPADAGAPTSDGNSDPSAVENSDTQSSVAQYNQQGDIAGEGFSAQYAPVSTYVQNGRLCCVAIHPETMTPMVSCVPISGYSNGVANMGADPQLDAAIAEGQKRLMTQGNVEQMKKGAEALVTRARCGDQNAMSIIALIGKNARGGSRRAAVSYALIQAYIQKNPVSPFGKDSNPPDPPALAIYKASAQMANSAPMTNEHIHNIVSVFGGRKSRKRRILAHGIAHFGHEEKLEVMKRKLEPIDKALLDFGRSIGRARAIQIARSPNGRIAVLSPGASWELGE